MALIDELKDKREECYHYMRGRETQIAGHQAALDDLRAQVADLDRAIAAFEAPAQPVHPEAELRSVTPATEETSGDQHESQLSQWFVGIQPQPSTIATLNAMDNPDRVGDALLTAFEDDHIVERAPIIDAQTCEEVDPHPEPELPEGWERRQAIRNLPDEQAEPEIPEGFARVEGDDCPVDPSCLVEVIAKPGLINYATQPLVAGEVKWEFQRAYRIIEAPASEQDALGGTYDGEFDGGDEPEQPASVEIEQEADIQYLNKPDPGPYDAAVEKGAITQDEADFLISERERIAADEQAKFFAEGMMADADRHQSDQRSIVEKVFDAFKSKEPA